MINLLPPSLKEELRGEEQFRLVLIVGILLLLFLLCLSLSLLSIRVYVSGEIQAQQILVESQKREGGESHVEQIRELNNDVALIASFLESRALVSNIIARLSNAMPEGLYLTSLNYTGPPESKIALRGFAPQTEDLLEFRTNLEQDPLFKNLRFPPSNWVRSSDIDFSFDFEL